MTAQAGSTLKLFSMVRFVEGSWFPHSELQAIARGLSSTKIKFDFFVQNFELFDPLERCCKCRDHHTRKMRGTSKMKKAITLSVAATLLSGMFLIGFDQAAEAKPLVNKRQNRQHCRIKNGIHSGELTKAEAKRMRAQQKALAKQEKLLRKTGQGLSKSERAYLNKEQNQLSKNIYRQKHDGQDRN